MMCILETRPDVQVATDEYIRLLGYPRGWSLDGRAGELAAWARSWYETHGRPWMHAVPAARLELERDGAVRLDGVPFMSRRLHRMLEHAGAHGAVVAAVSAGRELEDEARRRWEAERPDEYFFLEVFGSAVVEQLITMTGARLCADADADGMAVLPHHSPGYASWPVQEQPKLLDLFEKLVRVARGPARPLEALDSGMLRPKKSQLAVFGVTRHLDRVRRLTELRPCDNCSFHPCAYRRAPYFRPRCGVTLASS